MSRSLQPGSAPMSCMRSSRPTRTSATINRASCRCPDHCVAEGRAVEPRCSVDEDRFEFDRLSSAPPSTDRRPTRARPLPVFYSARAMADQEPLDRQVIRHRRNPRGLTPTRHRPAAAARHSHRRTRRSVVQSTSPQMPAPQVAPRSSSGQLGRARRRGENRIGIHGRHRTASQRNVIAFVGLPTRHRSHHDAAHRLDAAGGDADRPCGSLWRWCGSRHRPPRTPSACKRHELRSHRPQALSRQPRRWRPPRIHLGCVVAAVEPDSKARPASVTAHGADDGQRRASATRSAVAYPRRIGACAR